MQQFSRLCQPDRALAPIKQPNPQTKFKLLHLATQRRLGNMQSLGGGIDAACFDDGQKTSDRTQFDVTKFHRCLVCSYIDLLYLARYINRQKQVL
jgi:hypothetical protein